MHRYVLALAFSVAAIVGSTMPSVADQFTVLHRFDASHDTGIGPNQLTAAPDGKVFGAASSGHRKRPCEFASGCGTLFRVSKDGRVHRLHIFDSSDGEFPTGPLLLNNDTLYGTTRDGGPQNDFGVVFALRADGHAFRILHSFQGGTEGGHPISQLAMDAAGNLYGAAVFGPGNGDVQGVLYRIAPDGSYTVLHTLAAASTDDPIGLMIDHDGNLIGTAQVTSDETHCGSVFEYVPSTGSFSKLYRIPGRLGTCIPYISGADAAGNVYGYNVVAYYSDGQTHYGGQLFELVRSAAGYSFSTLYKFTDKFVPMSLTVLQDGTLYGIEAKAWYQTGGRGALFRYVGGTFTELHSFEKRTDGLYAYGAPVLTTGSRLIGSTSAGGNRSCGSAAGCGTLYVYTP